MEDIKIFASRAEFRAWLKDNCLSSVGIWLLFGKNGGPKTLKAQEALEEALCYGWIDGQMKNIDERSYKKYFCIRREHSKWSEKNKKLALALEEQGRMTAYGISKIEEAKKNGQWYVQNSLEITQKEIDSLSIILREYEPAYSNFQAMSFSIKKTYVKAFLDAKTASGREKRIAWLVDRLNKNLKPMDKN